MDSRSMKHGTQDALPRILKDIELKQAAQTGESLAFKLLLQRIGHQISVCLWNKCWAKKQIGWCRNVQITGNFGGKKLGLMAPGHIIPILLESGYFHDCPLSLPRASSRDCSAPASQGNRTAAV